MLSLRRRKAHSDNSQRSSHRLLFGLVVLFLIAAVGSYLYDQRGMPKDREVREFVSEIGDLALLPENETPALATITDPEKLGHQKFFKDSRKGDKVLIYSENKVVVLYRPSIGKLVNMGPVDIAPLDPELSKDQDSR